MRRKTFPGVSSIAPWFLIVVIFTVTIFQFGCTSSTEKSEKPFTKNWMTANIKFKPNASSEMRELSSKAIEELIEDKVDSVNLMRGGKYPKFSPKIMINKSPVGDTSSYQFNIIYASASDTIGNPPCTCKYNCGVCKIIQNYIINPDTSKVPAPFRNISEIEFLE
jgi:hypothetical protein